MNKLDLFIQLLRHAFNRSTAIPTEEEAQSIWGVTSRTIRNWLSGKREIPNWAMLNLRNYLQKNYKHLMPGDFSETFSQDDNCYARLTSGTTLTDDKDRLVAIIYHELDHIQKIVFFAQLASKDDSNIHNVGTLIICNQRYYLLDKTTMTVFNMLRELELQAIFKTISANLLQAKTSLILENVKSSYSMPIIDAVNTILRYKTVPLTSKNLGLFYKFMNTNFESFNPSLYFNDFGETTLQYILSTVDGIKVQYDKDVSIARITCMKKDNLENKLWLILSKFQGCFNVAVIRNKIPTIKAYYFDKPVEFSAAIKDDEIIITRHL